MILKEGQICLTQGCVRRRTWYFKLGQNWTDGHPIGWHYIMLAHTNPESTLFSSRFIPKGHCTLSPNFSSEIFARWKINTTSCYVNHVYTLPLKFLSVIKNSDRVRFFAFFASVASILRGVLTVQSHRRSERQNPEWRLSSSSTSSRSTKHCI